MKNTRIYKQKDTELYLDSSPRNYVLKVRDMPSEDKPREKLIRLGPQSLSLQELLAVILNVGNKNEDVAEVSRRIVKEYGERSIFAERNPEKLSESIGVSLVKACQIISCGEIGRRLYDKNAAGFATVRTAREVFDYLGDMRRLPKEHIRGLYLNSHNRIIRDEVLSIGTPTTNLIHPREVFRPAIEYNAAAVILAHNHPSGNLVPSIDDIAVTEQIVKAGKVVGIHLLDHVIITKDSFASIKVNY
jgi:DNA repair protein RadC